MNFDPPRIYHLPEFNIRQIEVRTVSQMEYDSGWFDRQKKRADERAYWAKMAPLMAQAQGPFYGMGQAAMQPLDYLYLAGIFGNIGSEPYKGE